MKQSEQGEISHQNTCSVKIWDLLQCENVHLSFIKMYNCEIQTTEQ